MTTVPKEKTLKKYLVALGKMRKNLIMKKDRKGYVAKNIALSMVWILHCKLYSSEVNFKIDP